jgi:hypothetical protein
LICITHVHVSVVRGDRGDAVVADLHLQEPRESARESDKKTNEEME